MKLKVDYLSKWLLFVVALAFSNFALAQRTITGTVTDAANGEPLIGANILVVGTSTGTITDFDGTYSLNVSEDAAELEFSYTGYASQRVPIGTSDVIDVQLSAGEVLEEVVVVGYGTQKQKEVTSAVTSVKAEDFNAGNVNDPATLIQGKVAGLSIANPGGDPNSEPTIRLRGLSTFGANTQPLIVIDGVIGASLQTVDPNDIASIDVLKDGSAAAIYGSRASSGVILITTKQGTQGRTTVDYNGFATAEFISREVASASPEEFRRYRPESVDEGANTDWLEEVTRTGFTQVHNLSLSGGFGGTSYRAALNVRDVRGINKESGFLQLNGRLNLTQKALNDRLTLQANLSITERESNFGFNEVFRYATTYNPTAPPRFPDNTTDPLIDKYGGYYQSENFDFFNPLAIQEQSINEGENKDILVSGRADYEFFDGFTGSLSYSQQRESDLNGIYYDSDAFWRGFNRNGLAERFTEDRTTQLFEGTLNFNRDFGRLNLDVIGGYSFQEFNTQNFQVITGDFIANETTYNNLSFSQDRPNGLTTINSFQDMYRVIAFFGRVNFNIDDTYFLSGTYRREGSSRFGAENKWGNFFGASAGVTISNLVDIPAVDNLKLRVGYGETGALPPSSYLSILQFSQQGAFFFNGDFVPAFGPSRNANPDLRWETKGEFDVGLDFALFDYKLTGTFDYYYRRTRDLIFEVPVPVPPNLADRTWANLDDVILENQGVELSLGYNFTNQTGDFSFEPRLVFSTFNTKLDTLEDVDDAQFTFFTGGQSIFFDFATSPGAPGLNNDPTIAVIAGEELGQIWGPVYEGVDEDGEFIFRDLNGDGTTDANGDGIADEEDAQVIGNGLPDFSLGFSAGFRYKNFDFNFFLRGDFGHDLANMYRAFYETLGTTETRAIENLVITEFFDENLTADPQFSSLHVEDASFVVLDNATLGYTFNLPESSTFRKLRLYLTGRNLFWITDYTGVDPSVRYADPGNSDNGGAPSRQFNPSPLAPGLDRRNTYFNTLSITFGANIGF